MVIADVVFDEFFSRPLPHEGFIINPVRHDYFGLIADTTRNTPELHGYTVTMDGDVVAPEFRPKHELKN